MYDVWTMQRTNIYLEDDQVALLRGIARLRGQSVAELVREAVDAWLERQGAKTVTDDDWRRALSEALNQQAEFVRRRGLTDEEIDCLVSEAVGEVRSDRATGRR